MNKILLFFNGLFLISGCAYTETASSTASILLMLNNNLHLDIMEGEVSKLKEYKKNTIYKLDVNSVRGGSTYLFGIFKIRESDGDKFKRISILKNDVAIKKISLNDIQAMPKTNVDSISLVDLNPIIE